MANIDLKTQIIGLVRLQKLDSEIYLLENQRTIMPQEIKALEVAFELKKQDLMVLEKQSLDLQIQRKEKELQHAASVEGVKKLNGQLFSLKTNKEFQLMQQQIADAFDPHVMPVGVAIAQFGPARAVVGNSSLVRRQRHVQIVGVNEFKHRAAHQLIGWIAQHREM